MRTRSQIIKIESAEYVGEYKLRLSFSDGKKQIVDFGPFLRKTSHSEIRKFLDQKSFKKFKIDHGELMWGDFDLIFPVHDLYENQLS